MISKYNGTCCHCGKPTKAGTDEYDLDTKKSFHRDCEAKRDLFSASEAEALADELGYCHAADVERMAPKWIVWTLSAADRGQVSRGGAASRGGPGALRAVPTGDPGEEE